MGDPHWTRMVAYNAILQGGGESQPRTASHARVVGVFIFLAMVGCVALLGAGGLKRTELLIQPGHVGLNRLANRVLQHGAELSVADMHTMFKNWAPSPPNQLDELSPAAMELLAANQGKKTEMPSARLTMLAPGDSKLCEKKDIILDKFDQLLRKLGGEELSLNISLGKMGAQWHRAMEAWLDSESTYRLRIEATKEAKENYMSGLKKHDIERQELDEERELIKEIMRFIGVLHDVKATEKSIAAGGRDSIKDEETGV